ncbi:MAG: hypothetical protein ACJAX2_002306 [Celeribacter sp.]|jgi:hypothetical protein
MKHAMARPKTKRPSAKARIFAAVMSCFAFGSFAQASAAQDAPQPFPVVVELFTSQGCSSCPPADALLAQLAKRDDVLALALHVDYWDYIGWKDIFADPRFTQRQRLYARAAGHRTIYTPQMIVNGQEHVVGFKPMKLADLIAMHRRKFEKAPLAMTAVRSGNMLSIALDPNGAAPMDMQVQIVGFRPLQNVVIRVGENAGKSIDYANIVTAWTNVGQWDGVHPITLNTALTSDDPVAVIVQQNLRGLPGAIVAALRIN